MRNTDFRLAITEYALRSGTLQESLCRGPPLRICRALRPRGAACAAERLSMVRVECSWSALDAALDLQDEAHLIKPGLIFAAHPTDGKATLCCHEEKELLVRTNWATGFLDMATCAALKGQVAADVDAVEGEAASCLEPGSPACLFAENLMVLRKEGQTQLDGDLVPKHKELPAALCILPRLLAGNYPVKADRLEYRRQVEAVLKVCCLLDLDGVCIGCSEGVAGSELFGHPLREAAQVWRDVLQDTELQPTPLAAHFKRIVFVSAKDNPQSAQRTTAVLREVLGDALLEQRRYVGPLVLRQH